MSTEIITLRPRKRPSYVGLLLDIPVGETRIFRLSGTIYNNFQNAKWRLKKSGRGEFSMRSDGSMLTVERLS